MKYEKTTLTTRNMLVREAHQQHPELSLEEIGEAFWISKQRVSKILKKV